MRAKHDFDLSRATKMPINPRNSKEHRPPFQGSRCMPTMSESRQTPSATSSRLIRRRFNLSVRALVLCPPLAAATLAFVLWQNPDSFASQGSVVASLIGAGLVWAALTLMVTSTVIRAAKPLLAIRSAMASIGRGETCTDALRISEQFGPEAIAWNKHLADVDAARRLDRASMVEEALATSKPGAQALEQACGALWIGCVVLDASRRIVFCNSAASRLLRAPSSQTIGKTADAVIQDPAALDIIRQADASAGRKRFTPFQEDAPSPPERLHVGSWAGSP